jgi:hypothetical protein
MDLLTLTDPLLGLDRTPVRVKTITEDSDGELTLVCEDYPSGVANAPLYPTQASTGFASDAYATPPSVASTTVFEAPGALAAGATGLEVWAAVRSPGGNWGGCTMWVSLDGGVTYRAVGRVEGGARMGQLAAALTAAGTSLQVTGMGGQLVSGSAADAQALSTLCYVGGSSPEYLAYQGAALTGAGAYTLSGLVRGALDTVAAAQASGAPFVRVDEGIVKSGALDDTMVGRLLHIKLTSFNAYGAAEQSLAEVSPITYTVTGRFRVRPPATGGQALNANPACDDLGAWEFDNAPNVIQLNTTAQGAVGARYFSCSGPGLDQRIWSRETIPLDPAKRYSLTANIGAAPGNNRNVYLVVRMFRADGTELTGADTGWGGSFAGYPFGGLPTADSIWRRYGLDFGAGVAGRPIPAAAAYCRVGFWFQYAGTGSGAVQQAVQDIRLEDVTAARLASDAAAAAQTTANTASGNATSALARIAAIDSDGILSRGEKAATILDWQALQDEEAGIVARANGFGIVTERDAYTSSKSALATYLTGLSPGWSDTSQDTTIVPAVYRATWADVYAKRQALLNRIAEVAGQRAQWASVSSRPRTFRVGAFGLNAVGMTMGADLLNAEDNSILLSGSNMYRVATINRSTLAVTDLGAYNTLAGGAIPGNMAAALNSITSSQLIVVVWTYDEPQGNRLTGGLLDAMLRHGASRAVFGSSRFRIRSAYILVGIAGCGEGNGAEVYAGDVDSSPGAYCELTFQLQNGALLVTGTKSAARALVDYGYVGDLNAEANSRIGLNASGQLTGIGAGNGTTVSNNQLALSPTGVLTNAGAPQGRMTTIDTVDNLSERSTNRPPNWYPVGTTREFKESAAVGLGGGDFYLTLETVIQYGDASGGACYQYAYRGTTTWRRWGVSGASSWSGGWVQDLDRNAYTGDLAATRNDVYRQATDPGAVPNGSIWLDTTTGRAQQRVAGAWQPYVGPASVNTGELALGATVEEGRHWATGPFTSVGNVLTFVVNPSADGVLKMTVNVDGTILTTTFS